MGCWSIVGLPPAYLLVPFVHLGAEKHCEIKVSRLRTQQSFKKTPTGRRQSSWLYTKCSQGVELGVTENKYCEKPGGGPSKRSNHSATLPPSIHVLFPTAFRVLLNMIFKICLIFSLFSPSLARGQRSRVCHQSH